MSAYVKFVAPKGLLVRRLTGLPLGAIFGGGRETLGESDILEGRRCSCAIDRVGCHDGAEYDRSLLDRALCWQIRHICCEERDIECMVRPFSARNEYFLEDQFRVSVQFAMPTISVFRLRLFWRLGTSFVSCPAVLHIEAISCYLRISLLSELRHHFFTVLAGSKILYC